VRSLEEGRKRGITQGKYFDTKNFRSLRDIHIIFNFGVIFRVFVPHYPVYYRDGDCGDAASR